LRVLKIGDSFIRSRMYNEVATSTIDSRNGIRQPQSANASAPRSCCTPRITSSDMNSPSVAVIWMKLVKNPRRSSGACSAT
jgi:hypothetical protein